MKVKVRLTETLPKEQYTIALGADTIQIDAGSSLAASYAKAKLQAGVESNRLGEVVGDHAPQFQIRLLQVDALDDVDQVVAMGYNTVITDTLIKDTAGLKVAMPATALDDMPACDYIVWKQDTLTYTGVLKDPTPLEKAVHEVQRIQQSTKIPVMYSVHKDCSFILELVAQVKVIVLFDAENMQVFTEIARRPIRQEYSLIPMLTLSQIILDGEKMCTDMPLAYIENILGRQNANRLLGAGCRVTSVSTNLAQMPIWIVGQRMWQNTNVYALFDMWLDRYYPEAIDLLKPKVVEIVHALFCSNCPDEAAKLLTELATILTRHKQALRFKKHTESLLYLSHILYLVQQSFKRTFEQTCAKAMLKIPLPLQNFTPVAVC
ncbi:MAG: hypothetical protein LLF94_04620 [Chlamydiales bacterium]|nr:hypothetical protein [Chlamydiales bacterium]